MVLLARGAFGGPAHVTRFDLAFSKKSVAGGTLAEGVTHGLDLFGGVGSASVGGGKHVMVAHTLFTEEFAMASRARVTGFSSVTLQVIVALGLATRATFLAVAGMMTDVIGIETFLALDAEMNGPEESWEGIAAMIVVSHFDENDLFVLGRSFEDDLILLIHREYDEAIVGEMTLKGLDLG